MDRGGNRAFDADSGSTRFGRPDGTEAMRIDSSGNLLVGTTTADAEGITLRGDSDYFKVVRNGGITAYFDRKTSDGTIVQFRKGRHHSRQYWYRKTAVVSILVVAMLALCLLLLRILFIRGIAEATHKEMVLLIQAFRHIASKDLYLSGGTYLGGTGSANHLDDYEEGTWTPSYGASSGSFTTLTMDAPDSQYTKIGRLVIASTLIRTDEVVLGTATGGLLITGLPFTVGHFGNVAIGINTNWNGDVPSGGYAVQGGTTVQIRRMITAGGDGNFDVSYMSIGENANHNYMSVTIIYYT